MTVILSARQIDRFTPASARELPPDAQPVYLIAPATFIERENYLHSLRALGVIYPSDEDIYAHMRAGVRVVAHADEHARLIEMIDQYEALPAERGGLAEAMDQLDADLRRLYPPYAMAMADRARYTSLSWYMAARTFLRGWERVDLPFRRDGQGLVPEELMERLPRDHLIAIGTRAMMLLHPDQVAEKNSASPSPSVSVRRTSRAGGSRPTADAAGASPATPTSTAKTRATRSRRKSGR